MDSNLYNEPSKPQATWSKAVGIQPRRSAQRDERVKRIHLWFTLAGLMAGVGAALLAWRQWDSIPLAIFAFFVANAYVGRGLGDVVTDQAKGRRLAYFTLQPLCQIGVLYGTYLLWEIWWLAAVLGFFVGLVLWSVLATVLFPSIHGEEVADSQRRLSTGGL
jgi:hypothetical protein